VFIADYSLCYFMSKSDGVYCQWITAYKNDCYPRYDSFV
jgi:hypothetical protein